MVLKCNKVFRSHRQEDLSDAQFSLALGVLGLSLQGISLKGFRGGLLSNDNNRVITRSSHQLMVEGVGYL